MKVYEITATDTNSEIVLEPEHPAEIALVNLFSGCSAECLRLDPPKLNAETDIPQIQAPRLKLNITVKKTRY